MSIRSSPAIMHFPVSSCASPTSGRDSQACQLKICTGYFLRRGNMIFFPWAWSTLHQPEEAEKNGGQKAGMSSKKEIIKAIQTIVTEISDEDGWAGLGAVGSTLSRRYPDFDTRNYGYSKLTPFIASLNIWEFIKKIFIFRISRLLYNISEFCIGNILSPVSYISAVKTMCIVMVYSRKQFAFCKVSACSQYY